MAEGKRKTTEERIKEVESQLLSNSKDAHFAKNLIQQLAGLYQMDKEIDIAIKDITDTIDLGACAVKRFKGGFIFEAKGGMQTIVSMRMKAVYDLCKSLFDIRDKKDKTEDEKDIYDNFIDAVSFCFQAPIFASLDSKSLFDISANILKVYREYYTENYLNAEPRQQTEDDIKGDILFENAAKATELMLDAPLPE